MTYNIFVKIWDNRWGLCVIRIKDMTTTDPSHPNILSHLSIWTGVAVIILNCTELKQSNINLITYYLNKLIINTHLSVIFHHCQLKGMKQACYLLDFWTLELNLKRNVCISQLLFTVIQVIIDVLMQIFSHG